MSYLITDSIIIAGGEPEAVTSLEYKGKALMPKKISECAIFIESDSCLTPATKASLVITDEITQQCGDSERCAVETILRTKKDDTLFAEYYLRFKVRGPVGTELLDNYNIDNVLRQWHVHWPNFYNYNFNMHDYAKYSFRNGRIVDSPDTLATVTFASRYKADFNCMACVINSDVYHGGGKHWMALFADWRDPDEWSVEFFNSSGMPPEPVWINWMVKIKNQMQELAHKNGIKPDIVLRNQAGVRHQDSKTECGVYSLFFIYARLCRVPFSYFVSNKIPDELMFEMRQHLFHDPKNTFTKGSEFSFDVFKKIYKVEWVHR